MQPYAPSKPHKSQNSVASSQSVSLYREALGRQDKSGCAFVRYEAKRVEERRGEEKRREEKRREDPSKKGGEGRAEKAGQ